MNQGRVVWLDCIRVAACFLVCVIHSPISGNGGGCWLSVYNYLSSPCIGLFFMVSGALLFPIKKPLGEYVAGKLKRIGIPLIFWSLVALGIHCMMGEISVESALVKIFQIPFAPVEGVYWFMYVIAGLYFFAPLLSPAMEKLTNVKYMLVLWFVSLCLPYLNAWIPNVWGTRGDFYSILGQFGGYMGYVVLGYYLKNKIVPLRVFCKRYFFFLLAVIIGIPLFFLTVKYPSVPNSTLYAYLTINVACMVVLYFVILQALPTGNEIMRKCLVELSQKSFGIYLIHIFIIREVLWNVWATCFPHASYAVQIPLTAVAAFLLSYAIIKLISLIPGTKHIF